VSWIPLVAWLGAVVAAAVVLGMCAYELTWKSRRLRADIRALRELAEGFAQLPHDATAARRRLARAGVS
jgi:hypothetical protein